MGWTRETVILRYTKVSSFLRMPCFGRPLIHLNGFARWTIAQHMRRDTVFLWLRAVWTALLICAAVYVLMDSGQRLPVPIIAHHEIPRRRLHRRSKHWTAIMEMGGFD
jgi:hypothetical protein